ncbi:MAG: CPBP family intramembrane glutamic endopeptidase [Bacteroidia bacterium]
MEPDETSPQNGEKKTLPFNNLFLNTGLVHGYNDWWMYAFGVCSVIFGYFIYQVIMLVPIMSAALHAGLTLPEIQAEPEMLLNPAKIGMNKNVFLALIFGMFVFALLGLWIAVTKIHRKPFRSIVTSYDNIRFGRFFFAFLVWGAFIVVTTLAAYFTDPASVTVQFNPGQFFILVVILLILLPIQTSTEEIFFRGYLVQGLSQVFKNGIVPLIITSVLFGWMHMSNPEAKTHGWMMMLPYYASFGFFLGAVTLLDEGLELALGVHCANNLMSGLLVTSPSSVLQTDAIFLVNTESPMAEFILWLVMATITFFIFWRKYRWKNFNLLYK